MNASFTRRNDPCPCGSGLRYKECHGKAAARGGEPGPDAAALCARGRALFIHGRLDEGVALVERARSMQPDHAELNAQLGVMRYVLGDVDASIRDLKRAIALAPGVAETHSNLALALRDAGDFEGALAAARRALELKPGHPPARLNLAMCLLALGRFAQAWPAFSWRPDPRTNLRDLAMTNSLAHAASLPRRLERATITLHGEQGLGDVLFFMRFARQLAERGARLRFWGDPRLGPMLVRSGLVAESFVAGDAPADLVASHLVWVGDLPALLEVGDVTPPPALLAPDEERVRAMRARLTALGPAPYVALTWRAGLERRGKAVLAKAIAPERLGAALRGARGTFVSVQRAPDAGESGRLEETIGVRVHELASLNDDLEDMLALMSVVDEYVGVSNTNVHLRAGTGRTTRVLIPHPPEWRWGASGTASPWFPDHSLYREARNRRWDEALGRLARDLGGAP